MGDSVHSDGGGGGVRKDVHSTSSSEDIADGELGASGDQITRSVSGDDRIGRESSERGERNVGDSESARGKRETRTSEVGDVVRVDEDGSSTECTSSGGVTNDGRRSSGEESV